MKNFKIIFLAIAIAGIGLRLIGIGGIQPINSDEASYLRQARFMAMIVKKTAGADLPVIDETEQGVWRYLRHNDWSEKPCWLHTGFVAFAMLIGGISSVSGIIVNIVFSLGTVLIVFFLTKRLKDGIAAGVSAGLLAVSGYWLIYSRSNWAEVDGVFFVVLAVYLLACALDHENWRHFMLVLAGGICGGVAVLCHYRLLYIIGPVGLMALMIGGKKRWLTNGLLIVIGYFGIIFSAAGIVRLIADGMGGDVPFSGLLGAIGERFFPTQVSGHVSQTNFQPLNSLVFIFYLLRNQGWCAFALMVTGIFALLGMRKRKSLGIGIVVFLLTPLVVLSMQKWVVARAAVVMVPFACIAAGIGASAIWEFTKYGDGAVRRIYLAILSLFLVGMVVENMVFDVRLLCNEYGTAEICEFLDKQSADVVYVDPESKITYGWFSPDLPYRKMDLLTNDKTNMMHNTYIVFDSQKYHMYRESVRYVSELEQQCATKGKLVFKTVNMTTMWEEFLMDGTQANSLMDMLRSVASADIDDITSIRVYKLDK